MQKKSPLDSASIIPRTLVVLLVCAAACLIATRTLPAFLRSEAPANVSQRTLSFAERVAYQRAIEDVYWRHRIWPKERPDPKPSLDAVMSQAQLEKKVADYLRKSQALEDYWQRPLTAEQLQAEMDLMAKHTRQPEVLRELFEAIGNDPFVIAECLARPALADRLLTKCCGYDRRVSGLISAPNVSYKLPVLSDGGCVDDSWTPTAAPPGPRESHTAVWTGSEMIVWGGANSTSGVPNGGNSGGKYNPSIDIWTPTNIADAPSARFGHTAIWTGTQMIVWGGTDVTSVRFNTGGKYNPTTDSWTPATTNNAPDGRNAHTAVWSGTEMIVWGGNDGSDLLNTGARYNPNTDSWTATSTTNAPSARSIHTAVWTG